MSNIDRAAEIIHDHHDNCLDAANALADAGLLATDILEYRVEYHHTEHDYWHPVTKWSREWPLHEGRTVAPDERIVCRRVSEPWEVTDE